MGTFWLDTFRFGYVLVLVYVLKNCGYVLSKIGYVLVGYVLISSQINHLSKYFSQASIVGKALLIYVLIGVSYQDGMRCQNKLFYRSKLIVWVTFKETITMITFVRRSRFIVFCIVFYTHTHTHTRMCVSVCV